MVIRGRYKPLSRSKRIFVVNNIQFGFIQKKPFKITVHFRKKSAYHFNVTATIRSFWINLFALSFMKSTNHVCYFQYRNTTSDFKKFHVELNTIPSCVKCLQIRDAILSHTLKVQPIRNLESL